MNGLELQQALEERGCQLPFVMITGYGDVPRVVEAFHQGAVDFIEKPFRSAQLLTIVRQMLDSKMQDVREQEESVQFTERCQTLTPRERELMDLLVAGLSTKQAAHEMGISPKTAYIHRGQVLEKMEVEGVTQLLKLVLRTSKAK